MASQEGEDINLYSNWHLQITQSLRDCFLIPKMRLTLGTIWGILGLNEMMCEQGPRHKNSSKPVRSYNLKQIVDSLTDLQMLSHLNFYFFVLERLTYYHKLTLQFAFILLWLAGLNPLLKFIGLLGLTEVLRPHQLVTVKLSPIYFNTQITTLNLYIPI